MSDFGTIKLDRGVFEHPQFRNDETFTEIQAWIWMVCAAVKSPRRRRVGNAHVDIDRGQLAYSNRYMAKCWKWNVSRVQRFLARLVTELMIQTVTESDVTRVTIVNYEKWQSQSESAASQQENAISTLKEQEKPPDEKAAACVNESPPNQISKNSFLTTDSESVGGEDARARESFITEQAFALAEEVMLTIGIDPDFPSPGWCGLAMWVQAGLNSGWRPELVRIAVARIRARKGFEIPFTFKYLAKPIQREHQQAAEPHLPISPVIVSNSQESSHAAKNAASRSWQQSRDNFRSTLATFGDSIDDAGAKAGGQDGAQVVRFATPAGRGRS